MFEHRAARHWLALSILLLVAAPLSSSEAAPAAATPVGVWKTVDEDTGKDKALVQVEERGGELQGRIAHLFSPSEPNPVCDQCEGERRNQPITGMQILWGFKRSGQGWSDGHILDPENGKTYKAKLQLQQGGAVMEVRGYLGVSALGRTQRWVRHDASAGETAGRLP